MKYELPGWFTNRPLIQKLLAAFALVLVCFVGTHLFNLQTFSRDASGRETESRGLNATRQLKVSAQSIRNQQLALRDYLLGSGEEALARFRDAGERRDDALAAAAELVGPQDQLRLEQVRSTTNDWQRQTLSFITEMHAHAEQSAVDLTAVAERYQHDVELRGKAAESVQLLDAMYQAQADGLMAERTRLSEWVQHASKISMGLLVLGLLVVLLTLYFAARTIITPIKELTGRMTALADGDLDVDIPGLERGDEIGDIARSLEVFRSNSRVIRDDNWVKISAGEVNSELQVVTDSEQLAQAAVSAIAPLIGAGIGVFFLWNKEQQELSLSGSYGFQRRKHLGLRYRLGEGLIGQAALERRQISLEQLPDDFFGIHSALGEAPPRQLLAVPLLYKEELLGVFEFGTFRRFSRAQEAFLQGVLQDIALTLVNVRAAEDTRRLLETTREQARELQESSEVLRVQEEELRATNDELQGKTVELEEQAQRLAASEEELRVQAEELQASNEELRQKTETLNEQKDVLEVLQRDTELKAQALARASQYKTDFLANMSHELRTPLNSLLILSRELADNESGHLDADEIEAAQVIHDSGSNLLRLINDILDLSKIEAGKMDVYTEPVPLEEIQREVVRHFRHVAQDKKLEFNVQIEAGLPDQIQIDRPKLQQILNNLLGNAFKFTREGAVSVRFQSTDDATVQQLDAEPGQNWMTIMVEDSGIGIPPDRLESIFEAFEQVDSSTSRHFGGSGLGLAIARRLAGLLGGFLLASSEVDKGSCFKVVLPLLEVAASDEVSTANPAQSSAPAVAAAPVAAASPMKSLAAGLIDWIPDDRNTAGAGEALILTIEDDPAFARILVDLIRRKGLRALAAADGESGLELARRYRPTGILLDVMLPGMDGWSVMQQLKADPVTASIPVHFISAVDEAAKGEQLGAIGYLTKPVERKALISAFDHLLEVAGKVVRKLLLVDDDADSRLALRKLLRADNLQIDEVGSGEEALQRIASQSYDCIVLDLNLGDITGLEFLERASSVVAVPPVVIYSAKDLSREDSLKLRHYTDSIVIKGHRSTERLLDEVSLFLHSIDKAAGQISASTASSSGLENRCVLLVDDDMRNLFALSKSLRARGMNVVMAQDGYKALQQLRDNPAIELVLMDIMMPGMDGYQTIGEIRAEVQWANLPIIAVTAKAMQGDRDKCLEAGANDYLSKPIDLDKLLSMMRVWLQK